MRGVEGKEGKRRFGFSYVLLVLAILTYLCAWGYSVFAADWKAKAEIPQIDPILKIIKGLRQYQQTTASFPQTFDQVESQVWKHANPPSYGSGGHTLVLKNYYYFYTWISPTRCTLWAIPLGSRASEASVSIDVTTLSLSAVARPARSSERKMMSFFMVRTGARRGRPWKLRPARKTPSSWRCRRR